VPIHVPSAAISPSIVRTVRQPEVVQRCTPKCTVFIGSRPPSPRRKLNAGRHLLERARRPAAGAALCTDLHRLQWSSSGALIQTSGIDVTNGTT
jgi:hypothetical protein